MKKVVEYPQLRKFVISSEGFLNCLKMLWSWTDAEYSNIVYHVMIIIANTLLLLKSDWGTAEDEYEVFEEKLKSYSETEWTDDDRGNIPTSSLQDILSLAEQEEVEVSRLFAISIMLRLCEGTEGESCKYHILENLDVDFIRELIEEDSGISSELKDVAIKLHELLTTFTSTKL